VVQKPLKPLTSDPDRAEIAVLELREVSVSKQQSAVQKQPGKRAALTRHTKVKKKRYKSGRCEDVAGLPNFNAKECIIEGKPEFPSVELRLRDGHERGRDVDALTKVSASQHGAPLSHADQRHGSLEIPDWVANYEPTQAFFAATPSTCTDAAEAVRRRVGQGSGVLKAPESNMDHIFAGLRDCAEHRGDDKCALLGFHLAVCPASIPILPSPTYVLATACHVQPAVLFRQSLASCSTCLFSSYSSCISRLLHQV
jgi:hypothetical protein